jgi:hypothetical protein
MRHLLVEALKLGLAYSTIIFLSSLSAFLIQYSKLLAKKILNYLLRKHTQFNT